MDHPSEMKLKRDMLLMDDINFQNEFIRRRTPELKEL
jgi:hypothetical protein